MRLVTRGDLDGLTCAVLLSLNEQIDSISLIHPQDISDGRADIRPGDVIANLPYHPGCAMWFDHHLHTDGQHPRGGLPRGVRPGPLGGAAGL